MEKTGIVGYGAYVPKLRIKAETIAEVWGQDAGRIINGLGITEKAVPNKDEDTTTIAVQIGKNALLRAGINPKDIGAVYVGSESHPYAVKPTSTIVAEALSVGTDYTAADTEFACKAGSAAIQMVMGLAGSGMIKFGLAIGADTAQGAPGDPLEYSAAAGGAGFIVGKDKKQFIATLNDTFSYSTDTPDFWRRPKADYPSHGGRFTGGPAYVRHVFGATNGLMDKTGTTIKDYDYVVFHMPNGKFPLAMAKKLDVPKEKLMPGFVVDKIGNTYSGCSLLGLAATLDCAKPGDKILITSYGSGAGSDSFSITVNDLIDKKRNLAPTTEDYIKDKQYITYPTYAKYRGKIV
ncbi:MAG: hydroxymethylglutaryl-CoA synthase [Candidatus Aenigmarchaeota archaeon]|nr:hydroxymethylglutaryl-CoA synthase [Candidatus Aenigmarchaeota archaeon]